MEEVWLYFYFFVFSSFKHRVKSILTQIDSNRFFDQIFSRLSIALKIHRFRNSKDISETPVWNSRKSSDFYNFARARRYMLKIREFGLKR